MSDDTKGTEGTKEFFFKADESGIVEIRHTNDPLYAIRVLLSVSKYVAGNLRNRETGEPIELAQFLADLSAMVSEYEEQEPEAAQAVEVNPLSH